MVAIKNKYLTFILENELYGIPIHKVKEIIGIMPITYIPKMAEFVKGVINLRGKIITVMDLRLKLGFDAMDHNERTCIVVVEAEIENGKRVNGLIVDSVADVLDISQENIENPPICGKASDNYVIKGIGKVKDKVIILLDLDKILSTNEIIEIEKLEI